MARQYWSRIQDFGEILDQERSAIATRAGRDSKKVWTGVSLSGGGIRSASFCLGGLQALAKYRVLSRIDYISTVSGGGYIGAGLQWLLSRDQDAGVNSRNFPYGVNADQTINRERGQSNLQYLRWHANYLLPGKGLDIFSALTVVIRTALLSVVIWFPLIVLFFYILQWLPALPDVQALSTALLPISPLPSGLLCPSWKTISDACTVPTNPWPDQKGHFSIVYALAFYLAYIALGLLAALTMAVAFTSITKFPTERTPWFVTVAIIGGIAGFATLAFETVLLIELYDRVSNEVAGVRGRVTRSEE